MGYAFKFHTTQRGLIHERGSFTPNVMPYCLSVRQLLQHIQIYAGHTNNNLHKYG